MTATKSKRWVGLIERFVTVGLKVAPKRLGKMKIAGADDDIRKDALGRGNCSLFKVDAEERRLR